MAGFQLDKVVYYYYDLLNGQEKIVYKDILNALLNVKSDVNLSFNAPRDVVKKIIKYVTNDRPDIFWYGEGCTLTLKNDLVEMITFDYRMSLSEVNAMKYRIVNSSFFRELDQLILSRTSDFDKALVAYEYIIKHTEYDCYATGNNSVKCEYAYNMDGVVIKNKAVCSGYSKVFQYFMNRHGIYCTLVTGKTVKGRHSWNLIKLYGSYYYIDVTWSDPVFKNGAPKSPDFVLYDYFCITTEELNKSHQVIFDNKMPPCVDTRCNYYRYYNMISTSFSIEDILSRIINAYRNGKQEAEIRYSSRQDYLIATRELFDNKKIFDVLSKAKRVIVTIDDREANFSRDEDVNIIKIKIR